MRSVKSLLPALSPRLLPRLSPTSSPTLLSVLLLATLFSSLSYAAVPDRITGTIGSSNGVALKGHVAHWATPQFDQGPVESSRTMRVTMLFMPTTQQLATLKELIADQQDTTSPKYHQWLTAQQFGQQFGLSQGDIGKISSWLQAQGFKITYVAKGQDFLSFEGNAGQVERAFQTQIHNYRVNGKMHFGNATAPVIPAALGGIVGGFRGLHDFTPHPMLKQHANYTFTANGRTFTALAPGDIATIYDINPLYQMNPKIDGTGQNVAIAGQSDVYLADLVDFRAAFGLSTISGCTLDSTNSIIQAGSCTSGNFEMVTPNGADPGLSPGALGESDLDIETLSGVARGAKIVFVTSPASTGGVDTSVSWAVDNQLAPVISYSYGLCEAFVTAPAIAAVDPEYMKADALGISFFAASGDAASATCDADNGTYPAILGPSVSYPASSAYLTGVGGTEFNEGSGSYWNSSNGSDGGSAKSYIPELGWNETLVGGSLDGSGGGPSNCACGTGLTSVTDSQGTFQFEICKAPTAGGFPKPSWQSGVTPNDSVRDVPDISFSASNYNDPYIVCTPQSEIQGDPNVSTSSCVSGITTALATYNSAFGGTSASTPVAAGMTALLNQYLGTNGLGLVNPQIYKLYGTNPSAFHDILDGSSSTTGDNSDNVVDCTPGTPSFTNWPAALQCPPSGIIGYPAGTGYDLVTGLGSIDMNALFTAWAASTARTGSSVMLASSATGTVQPGANVTFTATVTPTAGTGTVSFSTVNNSVTTVLGTALLNVPYPATTTGTAVLSTTTLPGGSNSVTATYEGDGSDKPSASAAVVVDVLASPFPLAAAPASATGIAGNTSGPVNLTITPVDGYNQATTLSCPSGLPTGATCSFIPNPVPANGTQVVQSTMTIVTTAGMAATTSPASITVSGTGSGVTSTATFSLSVTATNQSFTLTPVPATFTITPGQLVNASLTLTPTNGFNTPVTYTCNDGVSESMCTGPIGPTNETTIPFAITTTAPTQARSKPSGMGIFYAALLPGLLGIMFTAGSRKRSLRGMRLLGMICLLGFSTLWLGSCSGSGNSIKNQGTLPGTYSVKITGTTGGASPVTASATITVNVNN